MRHFPAAGRSSARPNGTRADLDATFYASRIESIGVALPDDRVTSDEVIDACHHPNDIDLEGLTGIRERRVCGEGEDSYSLAVEAAWDCLSSSRHDPGDVEMIISTGITKFCDGLSYRFEPTLSLSIKEGIGAGEAINFDLSNACAGMLTGVAVLDSFVRNGTIRCGMVVSGEYITSISDNAAREVRSSASRHLASLTVGDSGAAVIVDRADPDGPSISACEFNTHPEHSELCIGQPSMDGFGAQMTARASRLHKHAIDHCIPSIRRALDASGIDLDEIDFLIPHQTSVRAIRAGARRIEREIGKMARSVVENLENFGNTASTTHFVALERLRREKRLRPEDRVMLLAFASGIVVGSVVFEVGELGEVRGRRR